jgi:hypothetical protein
VENQHRLITGYGEMDRAQVDAFNLVKAAEAAYADVWKRVGEMPGVDRRALAEARTCVETGTMWLGRAIARPASPFASEQPHPQQPPLL